MIGTPEETRLQDQVRHGIVVCSKCQKEIQRCMCALRMNDCNKTITSICPQCAEQHMAQDIHSGGKNYVDEGIPIDTVAPVKAKPVEIIPFIVGTDKGPCIALQLKYAQPECHHCHKRIIFDVTEILLPWEQIKAFYNDLKAHKKGTTT